MAAGVPSDEASKAAAVLRAGWIPERCVIELRDRTTRRVLLDYQGIAVTTGMLLVVLLLRWGLDITTRDAGVPWYDGFPLNASLLLLASLVPVGVLRRRRRLLDRDLREKRVRAEEGELTRKWTRTISTRSTPRPGEGDSRGFWRHLAEVFTIEPADKDAAPIQCATLWVRIGKHTLEVGSQELYELLGSGVRYRMYLSEHSAQLIAIESIDVPGEFAGYRVASRPAAQGAQEKPR